VEPLEEPTPERYKERREEKVPEEEPEKVPPERPRQRARGATFAMLAPMGLEDHIQLDLALARSLLGRPILAFPQLGYRRRRL
jgi:hypothetical protein